MLTNSDLSSISKLILESEQRIQKDMATKKDLDNTEKRIYAHIEQVRFDVKRYTGEGVDTVLEGMSEMLKEKNEEYDARFEKIERVVFAV